MSIYFFRTNPVCAFDKNVITTGISGKEGALYKIDTCGVKRIAELQCERLLQIPSIYFSPLTHRISAYQSQFRSASTCRCACVCVCVRYVVSQRVAKVGHFWWVTLQRLRHSVTSAATDLISHRIANPP